MVKEFVDQVMRRTDELYKEMWLAATGLAREHFRSCALTSEQERGLHTRAFCQAMVEALTPVPIEEQRAHKDIEERLSRLEATLGIVE